MSEFVFNKQTGFDKQNTSKIMISPIEKGKLLIKMSIQRKKIMMKNLSQDANYRVPLPRKKQQKSCLISTVHKQGNPKDAKPTCKHTNKAINHLLMLKSST